MADKVENTDTVEPGYRTTEFWVVAATGVTVAVVGVLVSFGLNISDAQKASIVSLEIVAIPAMAGLYALARSIRKFGQ